MLRALALVLATITVVLSVLPLSRARAWWVRIWDFPRLQVTVVGLGALALWGGAESALEWPELAVTAAVGVSVLNQAVRVWRYTSLAPCEVQAARAASPEHTLSLAMCNVLQTNREGDRLVRVLQEADADVVLCVETDRWWESQLDALVPSHPHVVRCPLDNTYGMLLYSRLPLDEARVDFLVQPDIPSMQAYLRLRGGRRVWLNCVHPRPPAPGEADESLARDGELLLVGRRVRESPHPVVVCGDLNDVAWSHSTRLFQKVSRLVDPRKGRGFFSTFHARYPGFRYPLDHVFHSDDFRLVAIRRLPYVGSDHFPVYVALSHEPVAAVEQEAPASDASDLREADRTIGEARVDA